MKEKKITIFESVLRVGKEKFSRDLQIIGCLAVNGILFDLVQKMRKRFVFTNMQEQDGALLWKAYATGGSQSFVSPLYISKPTPSQKSEYRT